MGGPRVAMFLAIAAAVLAVGAAAQQEVQTRPGFGSGTMNVNVINHPAVTAAQSGDWRVSVANVPDVRVTGLTPVTVAGPSQVRAGVSYLVAWPGSDAFEKIRVVAVGADGWVEVQKSAAGRRWVNLSSARSIEEAQ